MISLTDDELKNVAILSRLTITKELMPSLKNELSSILLMIEKIQDVNTDLIIPLAHPLETKQFLRDDVCQKNTLKPELQLLSTHIEDDLYIVPKVID